MAILLSLTFSAVAISHFRFRSIFFNTLSTARLFVCQLVSLYTNTKEGESGARCQEHARPLCWARGIEMARGAQVGAGLCEGRLAPHARRGILMDERQFVVSQKQVDSLERVGPGWRKRQTISLAGASLYHHHDE